MRINNKEKILVIEALRFLLDHVTDDGTDQVMVFEYRDEAELIKKLIGQQVMTREEIHKLPYKAQLYINKLERELNKE